MNFELVFLALILVLGILLLLTDHKKAVYILLVVSVLLHKELFSIYAWNILPARVFMMSLLVFITLKLLQSARNRNMFWIKRSLTHPAGAMLVAFWVIAGLSMFYSKNIQASLSLYAYLTTIVALYFYLSIIFEEDSENVLKVLKTYSFIAFLLSIIGFIQIFVFEKYQFIFGSFWDVPGHTPRIGSLFWDVNHFAGLLALLLPLVIALVITSNWKLRPVFLIIGLSILATLALTNGRSGWIAAGLAILSAALVLIYRKYRYKGLSVLLCLVLLMSIGVFSQYLDKQSPVRHKIRQYFHYRLDSFDSHFLLLTGSWQIFEKYPFLGGGYGSFYEHFSKTKISATYFSRDPAALNTRVPAHSIWGELLAETGILGFAVMLIFYSCVVFTLLYASLRLKKKEEYIIFAAMFGSVVGILAAGVFYSYNSEFFWIILFSYFLYGVYSLQSKFGNQDNRLWGNIYSYVVSNPRFPALVLLIISSVLIFRSLGSHSLIPFDEAIYAQVSRNINQNGDWITMHWNDVSPWFEKPPLYFWTSALALRLIPNSPELAVRLTSAISGLLLIMLTYSFGKRLFGKTAGFISGLCLATTFHFLYYARTGMLDVTSAFFITASLYFYHLNRTKLFAPFLSGVFSGFAVLTKGVLGFFPLIIISIYELTIVIFMLKDNLGNKRKIKPKVILAPLNRLLLVAAVSAVVFLPWHFKMYQLYGQKFLDSYLGYHVLGRVTTGTEYKTAPYYWYIVVLKVSMRLWFVPLFPALGFLVFSCYKKLADRRNLLFSLIWAMVIMGVFSVSKSKLIWYIIPVYPALSIIIGYFYSFLLRIVDNKLSKLSNISSFFLKGSVVYLTILISLMYLLLNKGLVYTGDLTGPQRQMMQTKNLIYGPAQKLYLDRIELPLALFYTNGLFEITEFTPLRESIAVANNEGSTLVFITKESRFKKLQNEYPAIKFVSSSNEWYLGELVGK